MKQEESGLKESDFLRVLWDYFSMHGAQRMQMLNFYIILEGLFITALAALELTLLKVLICIAIIFFSLVFWGLDIRTKRMVKLSEDAIKFVEKNYEGKYGKEIMIFNIEMERTASYERSVNWIMRQFMSYTKLFRLVYIFFMLIGVVGGVMELLNIFT